jgi:predicted nucleic acid-binding protein
MKKKVVLLDSSVWVSFILKNDVNHNIANNILCDFMKTSIILMPNIVFYEVVTVLMKLNKAILIKEFLDFDLKVVNLNHDVFLKYAMDLGGRICSKTHDFLILVYCLDYNVDVFITFDKKQEKNYHLLKKIYE